MIVVKVGGSLFDHPRLGPGLRTYLDSLAPEEVYLVPGGGDLVDAVRKLDHTHKLGEESSHWLALRSMSVNASFLADLIDLPTLGSRVRIPDCFTFAQDDEGKDGTLPHSWDVTSDSIAARIAVHHAATKLILLKSIDIATIDGWHEVAVRGWVDRYFPRAVSGANMEVKSVNFARFLDSLYLTNFQ